MNEIPANKKDLATVGVESQPVLPPADQPLRVAGHIVDSDRIDWCKECQIEGIVTFDEPPLVRKKALFRIESGTIGPDALNFPAELPVEGSTM